MSDDLEPIGDILKRMPLPRRDKPNVCWILVGGEAVAVEPQEWARWFEKPLNRCVGSDDVQVGDEVFWVSTVFLGIDQNFNAGGPPLLFETMVFKRVPFEPGISRPSMADEYDVFHYETLEQAEAGHKAAVEAVKAGNTAFFGLDAGPMGE